MEIRSLAQRKHDTLRRLEHDQDVWVATAQGDEPHLVPLSLDWDGEQVIVATERRSKTAQNTELTGRARLAVGPSRDVTVLNVEVRLVAADEVAAPVGDHFAQRNGWDPRQEEGAWAYLLMKPERIQAWRNTAELAERTLMRRGEWVV